MHCPHDALRRIAGFPQVHTPELEAFATFVRAVFGVAPSVSFVASFAIGVFVRRADGLYSGVAGVAFFWFLSSRANPSFTGGAQKARHINISWFQLKE
jgi:hypothetical protein